MKFLHYWNKIPFIREFMNVMMVMTLLLPYTLMPGIVSVPYVFGVLILSLCLYLSSITITRILSVITALYSFVHLIIELVFLIGKFELNENTLTMFGVNFDYFSRAREIGFFISIFCVFGISVLSAITVEIKREYSNNRMMTSITSLLLFCLSLLINSSQGGCISILLMIISFTLFIIPSKAFNFVCIPTAFLLMIYFVLYPFYSLIGFVTLDDSLIKNEDTAKTINNVMSSLGFSIVQFNSPTYSCLFMATYLIYYLFCACIKVAKNSYSMTIVPMIEEDGYTKISSNESDVTTEKEIDQAIEKDEDEIKENETTETTEELETKNKQKKSCKEIMKSFTKGIVLFFKCCLQIVVNCLLYISIALMFCVGLCDMNVFGLLTLLVSIICLFIPTLYLKKGWLAIVIFNILEIIVLLIIQLPVINVEQIPEFVGLVKFYDPKENVEFKMNNTILKQIAVRIVLLIALLIQYAINKVGFAFETNSKAIEIVKYSLYKFFDQWGVFLCCLVFAVASLIEKINVELVFYIIGLIILVSILVHSKHYKEITIWLLPLYSTLFSIILIVRYICQFVEFDSDTTTESSADEMGLIELFTKLNRAELGIINYEQITDRIIALVPNALVIFACAITHRLLISIPKYIKATEEDLHMPSIFKTVSRFIMRFFAIYIPHISLICAIILSAYPTISTTDEVKTWDLLHFILFISTLVSLVSKKGFNIACIPILWTCLISFIFLLIPNFHTFDEYVNINIFEDMEKGMEIKQWIYKTIGIKTCYDGLMPSEDCIIINGISYPSTNDLIWDFVLVLFLIIISKTSYHWGEKYLKRNSEQKELTLFILDSSIEQQMNGLVEQYKDDPTIERKEISFVDKLKYYISHFYDVFGSFIVLITMFICAGLHSNDVQSLIYILFAGLAITLPKKVVKACIPIVEVILVILLIFNSLWTLPLNDMPFFDSTQSFSNKFLYWDYNHTIQKYFLLYPIQYGERLLAIRIFDSLCIFFLYRLNIKYNKYNHQDIYQFLCPSYFPQETKTVTDKIVKWFLKYFNTLISIIILLIAITRKDVISYYYLLMMFIIVYKDLKLTETKYWKQVQIVNMIILIIQNIFVMANIINYFKEQETDEKKLYYYDVLAQVTKTIGLNYYAEKDFRLNLSIYFFLLTRTALITHVKEVLEAIDDMKKQDLQKIHSRTKELIDLDRNKILLELDKQYNDKVMRIRRLEELRTLRENGKLTEVEIEPKEKEKEIEQEESSFKQSLEKIWNVIKGYWWKFIDSIIHLLHNRNLFVRLNIPIDSTKDEVENELIKYNHEIIDYSLSDSRDEIEIQKIEESNEDQNIENELHSSNRNDQLQQEENKNQIELIDVPDLEQKPYLHHNRLYMIIWGIWFYCTQSTEVFVQLMFILNHLFNGNLISMIPPMIGFGFIMLVNRPYPKKIFWNIMTCYMLLVILTKMFIELPGFCVTTNDMNEFDYLSYSYKGTENDEGIVKCLNSHLTHNEKSFIYILGIYPQTNYIKSTLIFDILCIFALYIHISSMKTGGYWKKEYLLRREWSNIVIENYRRDLTNRIKPNTYEKLPFVVQTKVDNLENDNPDYLKYNKYDLFVVKNIQIDGSLYVKRNGKKGLINPENVKIFEYEEQQQKETKKLEKEIQKEEKQKSKQEKKEMKKNKKMKIDENKEIKEEKEVDANNEKNIENIEKKQKKIQGLLGDILKENKEDLKQMMKSQLDEMEKKIKAEKYKEDQQNAFIKFFKQNGRGIKQYYDMILNDKFKQGKDYYVPMFVSEMLCFIFLILLQPTFIDVDGDFVDFLTRDYLPIGYVLGLLIQFFIILGDRIIYLCKSVTAKLIMQYFTIILYHALIFLYYPLRLQNKTDLTDFSLIVFYIFKIFYWYISGLQITVGYKILSSKRLLMSNYSYVSSLIFSTYYSLPFVYEIRTILDWTFAKTSMFYKLWLKVEDIHAELYMNQCDRELERSRGHVYGKSRGLLEKLTGGCIMIIVMLFILWFPLLLMSSASPGFMQPAPTNLEMDISFVGNGILFEQDCNRFYPGTQSDYKTVENSGYDLTDNDKLFFTELSLQSMTYWALTPTKMNQLQSAFCVMQNVEMKTNIRMKREESGASNDFSFTETIKLTPDDCLAFCEILQNNSTNRTVSFFPEIVSMPVLSETDIKRLNNKNYPVSPTREKDIETKLSYWSFINANNQTTMKFYVVSPNVPSAGILSSLSSFGILGLYTVVVLAVYNLIKSNYSGLAHEIMFKQLPNNLSLLQLCDDIIIARQDGDLELEEDLVDELIMIYRNPLLLIEKSK